MRLNNRRRHQGGEVSCDLCGGEVEDIQHFMLDSPDLENERRKIPKLQRPQEEDRNRIIGELIFGEEDQRRYIYEMWKRREQILKTRNEE